MNPFDFMRPMIEASRMMVEAQQVIALRMAGMAGVWSMGPAENQRMVEEKVAAMTESAMAAMAAGLSGKSPAAVAMAAIRPVRRRTRANASRLGRKASGGGA
jgi:hypothetical protein